LAAEVDFFPFEPIPHDASPFCRAGAYNA
jgi:hypothetical protein